MTDRTFGETKDCAGCRYWSETVAQSIGGGPVAAMCLVDVGRYAGKYTVAPQRCDSWKSGHFGPIDDPPGYAMRLYTDEAARQKNHQRKRGGGHA